MFAENRKISIRQLQMLLLLDCFGTAVLFLPAELAEISGRGCFFAALLGGLGVSAASLLLTAVGRRMPNGTVVDWCRSVCGNAIGTILLLGLAGKLLLDGMLELRIFSEIICRFMLPATPVWVLSLVLLLVAGALAAQGTECRGRTAEILFFLVAIPLLLVLLAVAASTRYARVLPLALPSPSGIGAGLTEMSIVFRGLVFLYFIYPDLKKPVGFAVWKGCLLITAVVTVIVLLCLANYGEGMLAAKLLPTLQMLERVSFTGVFLTRQDLLLLWFWMASAVLFLSGVVFFGSLLGTQLCRQAIDDYFADPKLYEKRLPYYLAEVSKASHRDYTTAFYYGKPDGNQQVYTNNSYIREYDFIGMVQEDWNEETGFAWVEQRNKFSVGEEIEVMPAQGDSYAMKVTEIRNQNGETVASAPHPQELLQVKFEKPVKKFDMLRKRPSDVK